MDSKGHVLSKKTLTIIPVFNEERNLSEVLQLLPKKVLDVDVDVLVIDDGSTDKSRILAKHSGAIVIHHNQRKGYGFSVREGFKYAITHKYDYVVKLDGDGQHDIKFFPIIIKILRRGGVDYVISSRYKRCIDRITNPPLDRRLVNIMFTGIINQITKQRFTDVFCGFFGLTRDLLKKVTLATDGYGLELELILKAWAVGARILEIPHPLIYTKRCSKFLTVFGKKHNLGMRVEYYTNIVLNTLKEIKIQNF